MIIRKVVAAELTCSMMLLLFFIQKQTSFIILLGVLLFLILLMVGVPTSILSDFVTQNLRGFLRAGIALLIHLFLASLFALVLILISEQGLEGSISNASSLLDNFLFNCSLLSSLLFFCSEELLKSSLAHRAYQKILLSKK